MPRISNPDEFVVSDGLKLNDFDHSMFVDPEIQPNNVNNSDTLIAADDDCVDYFSNASFPLNDSPQFSSSTSSDYDSGDIFDLFDCGPFEYGECNDGELFPGLC